MSWITRTLMMLNSVLLGFGTQIYSTPVVVVSLVVVVETISKIVNHYYQPRTLHFSQSISCHDNVFGYLFWTIIVIIVVIGF